MKVFAVCPECDDLYYGFMSPEKIYKSFDDAADYAKSKINDVVWSDTYKSMAEDYPDMHFTQKFANDSKTKTELGYQYHNNKLNKSCWLGPIYLIQEFEI